MTEEKQDKEPENQADRKTGFDQKSSRRDFFRKAAGIAGGVTAAAILAKLGLNATKDVLRDEKDPKVELYQTFENIFDQLPGEKVDWSKRAWFTRSFSTDNERYFLSSVNDQRRILQIAPTNGSEEYYRIAENVVKTLKPDVSKENGAPNKEPQAIPTPPVIPHNPETILNAEQTRYLSKRTQEAFEKKV